MSNALPWITFIVGLLFGGLISWLWLRSKTVAATETVRAAGETEIRVLQERLVARETRLAELQAGWATAQGQLTLLQADLQAEKVLRAGFEQAASELPALREGQERLRAEATPLRTRLQELETTLDQERAGFAEKQRLLDEAQARMTDAFKALSADALRANQQSFLELAETRLATFQEAARSDLDQRQGAIDRLVLPVQESLGKFDTQIQELEKARVGAYETLREQVRSLGETQVQLRNEAANLVKALRAPQVRGRWGEIQLKRVVEMAGMLDHCDFFEQQSASGEDGRLRPDLIVKLPGGKKVVVDAKAPLAAYLEAVEAPDDLVRAAKLREHARQIRDHMKALSAKGYWDQFQPAPEFVVLFLPGEMFFSAALEQDPSLIEQGVEQRVILATPTTLIALLKAVSYGWRQENLAANAQKISELGQQLYKRVQTLGQHFGAVGKNLQQAVNSYNQAVNSLEGRLLVTARRFKELEVSGTEVELEPLLKVEVTTTVLQAAELLGGTAEPPAGEVES